MEARHEDVEEPVVVAHPGGLECGSALQHLGTRHLPKRRLERRVVADRLDRLLDSPGRQMQVQQPQVVHQHPVIRHVEVALLAELVLHRRGRRAGHAVAEQPRP
jgi:hypothetical protein